MKKKEILDRISKALKKLENGTDAEKAAAAAGIGAGLLISNNESLFTHYNDLSSFGTKLDFIKNEVLFLSNELGEKERKAATNVLNQLKKDPGKLSMTLNSARGMIFNSGKIDSDGYRCDDSGRRIEDDLFRLLPGTSTTPWKITMHYDPETDELLKNPSSSSKEVNAMGVILPDEGLTLMIAIETHPHIVRALVETDIEENPNTLWRYLCGIWKDDVKKKTGEAHDVRDVVIDAAKKSRHLEFSGGNNELIKMIQAGHAQCMQHIQIGIMKTVLGIDNVVLRNAPEEDISRYLELVNLFADTEDNQKKTISDEILDTYCDSNGEQLAGIDSTGKVISGNTNTASCKRAYLRTLAKQLAEKLLQTFALNGADHPLKQDIIDTYYTTIRK